MNLNRKFEMLNLKTTLLIKRYIDMFWPGKT